MSKDFSKGIIQKNPLMILLIGLCPALAVSTRVINALSMGGAAIFVLLGSNLCAALLRNFIPEKLRLACYLILIAVFVTIVDLFMRAFTPIISADLGIYVQLLAVNCLILGRAQTFAGKNNLKRTFLDASGMGLGFTLALTIIALIREIVGSGKITLFAIAPIGFNGEIIIPALSDFPIRLIAYPAGAFLILGLLKALSNWLAKTKKEGS